MGDESIGIGILGTAAIARKNIRAIKLARNGLEVVAVGSRSKEKAASYIKEVEGAAGALAYGSYEEVLDEPNVQAVYIPLPTSMHLEWVQKAAAKGKHVLLEKPIAMTRVERHALMKACSEATMQ